MHSVNLQIQNGGAAALTSSSQPESPKMGINQRIEDFIKNTSLESLSPAASNLPAKASIPGEGLLSKGIAKISQYYQYYFGPISGEHESAALSIQNKELALNSQLETLKGLSRQIQLAEKRTDEQYPTQENIQSHAKILEDASVQLTKTRKSLTKFKADTHTALMLSEQHREYRNLPKMMKEVEKNTLFLESQFIVAQRLVDLEKALANYPHKQSSEQRNWVKFKEVRSAYLDLTNAIQLVNKNDPTLKEKNYLKYGMQASIDLAFPKLSERFKRLDQFYLNTYNERMHDLHQVTSQVRKNIDQYLKLHKKANSLEERIANSSVFGKIDRFWSNLWKGENSLKIEYQNLQNTLHSLSATIKKTGNFQAEEVSWIHAASKNNDKAEPIFKEIVTIQHLVESMEQREVVEELLSQSINTLKNIRIETDENQAVNHSISKILWIVRNASFKSNENFDDQDQDYFHQFATRFASFDPSFKQKMKTLVQEVDRLGISPTLSNALMDTSREASKERAALAAKLSHPAPKPIPSQPAVKNSEDRTNTAPPLSQTTEPTPVIITANPVDASTGSEPQHVIKVKKKIKPPAATMSQRFVPTPPKRRPPPILKMSIEAIKAAAPQEPITVNSAQNETPAAPLSPKIEASPRKSVSFKLSVGNEPESPKSPKPPAPLTISASTAEPVSTPVYSAPPAPKLTPPSAIETPTNESQLITVAPLLTPIAKTPVQEEFPVMEEDIQPPPMDDIPAPPEMTDKPTKPQTETMKSIKTAIPNIPDSRTNLLESIRSKPKLKKVADPLTKTEGTSPKPPTGSTLISGNLMETVSKSMQLRSKSLNGEEGEDEVQSEEFDD